MGRYEPKRNSSRQEIRRKPTRQSGIKIFKFSDGSLNQNIILCSHLPTAAERSASFEAIQHLNQGPGCTHLHHADQPTVRRRRSDQVLKE